MPRKTTQNYLVRNIPLDLWQDLRVGTVARNTTLRREILTALIQLRARYAEESSHEPQTDASSAAGRVLHEL